jgi:hypothetical protein
MRNRVDLERTAQIMGNIKNPPGEITMPAATTYVDKVVEPKTYMDPEKASKVSAAITDIKNKEAAEKTKAYLADQIRSVQGRGTNDEFEKADPKDATALFLARKASN